MRLKILAVSFLLLVFSEIRASDLFKVAPYTLKHTNGHLILNFQLNQTKKLVIVDGPNKMNSREFSKDEHNQIELRNEECGSGKDINIVDSTDDQVLYSKSFPPAVCKSSDNSNSFAFGFISDTQQFRDRHESISKVIAHHHSIEPLHFLINGGDVVQTGGSESEWIEYFNGGNAYLMDIPQIAAIGNHDYRGKTVLPKYFQKYMRWPGSPTNGNLFFDLPDFQMVIWNSNEGELTKEENSAMWIWLEQTLINARKIKKPVFIATHFPVYSSSMNRFTSGPVRELREKLVPLVEKYKVPLVLGGHTHMYERSLKDGIHYVVAGPAGGRVNKPTFKNPYRQMFDSDALTFTKIKYENKRLNVETYNQSNVLIDSVLIDL